MDSLPIICLVASGEIVHCGGFLHILEFRQVHDGSRAIQQDCGSRASTGIFYDFDHRDRSLPHPGPAARRMASAVVLSDTAQGSPKKLVHRSKRATRFSPERTGVCRVGNSDSEFAGDARAVPLDRHAVLPNTISLYLAADAGTVERSQFGNRVMSSADLVQQFERVADEALASHLEPGGELTESSSDVRGNRASRRPARRNGRVCHPEFLLEQFAKEIG